MMNFLVTYLDGSSALVRGADHRDAMVKMHNTCPRDTGIDFWVITSYEAAMRFLYDERNTVHLD